MRHSLSCQLLGCPGVRVCPREEGGRKILLLMSDLPLFVLQKVVSGEVKA